MSGILRLESLTKGNTLKQGDKTPLKYRLFDADGEKLNIAGKTAKVRLVYPDFLTIGYEKDGLTVAQDDTVTFTIDKVIPAKLYHVEIIVDDKFIFPSREDESKFTVDKSSLGTEANIIEIVGVDAVARKATGMMKQDEKFIDDMTENVISDSKVQSFAQGIDAKATNALNLSESADTLSKSVQEQFNQVVIDGDSSVEAAQARVDASGHTNPTLKARLDKEHNEVTTQLAETAIIVGDRLEGETNDNGRIQRAFDLSVGGTCKIPSGTFYIDVNGTTGANRGLIVPSNINIVMNHDTVLKAIPTDKPVHTILSIVSVENVSITGGNIIGERYEHTGTTGEHGMGINILHSVNVTIDNVNIEDCWGDCIYIGGNNWGVNSDTFPKKITIKNCTLNNSRRQGLSMTLGDGVIIENCRITNINGTAPEYGIDIETNDSTKPCKNVMIKNCYFNGSAAGGFVIGSNAENIAVDSCIFDGDNVNINKSLLSSVTNCTFTNTSVDIRSSSGVNISSNVFNNSIVVITANYDETKNTSITSNLFQNNDGDVERKGISLVGINGLCRGLSIVGNSFYDYISETIFFYAHVQGLLLNNNLFRSSNVTRMMMILRGYDMKISGNSILIDAPTHITILTVIDLISVRGSFDNNTIRLVNASPVEAHVVTVGVDGQSQGATISNNVIYSTSNNSAVKLPSSGDTKFKVINNDFGYTNTAVMNPTGHYVQGNIIKSMLI